MFELNKRVYTEAAAHRADDLQDRFRNMHRKTPMLDSVFNKVAGLELSCQFWKIFKNSFFHKKPPVVASQIFTNFVGKHQT